MSRTATRKAQPVEDVGEDTLMADPAAAPARELMVHLLETGTPNKLLKGVEDKFLRATPKATAEDLYRHLEAEGVATPGTLRKAGKWIWGPTFEPESVVAQAPEEEITRLRRENEVLSNSNRTLSAEKLGLTNANTHLQQRVNDLQSQVAYLSQGRSPAELSVAGILPAGGSQ